MIVIISPLLYNVIVVRPKIYYRIEYDIIVSNREEIIDRVENLNYPAYLNDDYYSDLYEGITSFVDRDLIDFLKSRIESDIRFRLSPFYQHNLHYSFLGEHHSKLFLTYNDNRIFSIKDDNNRSLFVRQDNIWPESNWYLNFPQIPHVYEETSTLMLNDTIFVKMKVDYLWVCGYICLHDHSYEQYLLLDENLDIMLIFIYFDIFID